MQAVRPVRRVAELVGGSTRSRMKLALQFLVATVIFVAVGTACYNWDRLFVLTVGFYGIAALTGLCGLCVFLGALIERLSEKKK